MAYQYDNIAYSKDGVTWDVKTLENASSLGNYYKYVTGNGSVYLFVDSGYVQMYSRDGINWTNSIQCLTMNGDDVTSDIAKILESSLPFNTGNDDTEIILASSTEGSTKRFKITVDDSGTLTATEII